MAVSQFGLWDLSDAHISNASPVGWNQDNELFSSDDKVYGVNDAGVLLEYDSMVCSMSSTGMAIYTVQPLLVTCGPVPI